MNIRSDNFVPYPKLPNHPGNGAQTAGILAGSPPTGSSPASNPALPVTISPLIALTYHATIVGVAPTNVSIPNGASTLVKYAQVVNQGAGFVFVSQGSEMGVIPPFTMCSYTLTSSVGSPIQLQGWDGGNPLVTGTSGDIVVLWSSNPFRNDLSWDTGGGSSGGSGVVRWARFTPVTNTMAYDSSNPPGYSGQAESWSATNQAWTLSENHGLLLDGGGTHYVGGLFQIVEWFGVTHSEENITPRQVEGILQIQDDYFTNQKFPVSFNSGSGGQVDVTLIGTKTVQVDNPVTTPLTYAPKLVIHQTDPSQSKFGAGLFTFGPALNGQQLLLIQLA